jgi:recombinational DNA repair ATPase RecF
VVTRSQLGRIELQGFRSFGNVQQFLDLASSVSTLWGGNSQGKTSFVEALEFLFTGQIARRELLASTKDEFAEALRNAHIPPAHPV